jgi:hypothetical protein
MTEQERIHQRKLGIAIDVQEELLPVDKGDWLYGEVKKFENGELTLRELNDSWSVPF